MEAVRRATLFLLLISALVASSSAKTLSTKNVDMIENLLDLMARSAPQETVSRVEIRPYGNKDLPVAFCRVNFGGEDIIKAYKAPAFNIIDGDTCHKCSACSFPSMKCHTLPADLCPPEKRSADLVKDPALQFEPTVNPSPGENDLPPVYCRANLGGTVEHVEMNTRFFHKVVGDSCYICDECNWPWMQCYKHPASACAGF